MHPNCTWVCASPHVCKLVLTNLFICKVVAPIVVTVSDYLQRARLTIILDKKNQKLRNLLLFHKRNSEYKCAHMCGCAHPGANWVRYAILKRSSVQEVPTLVTCPLTLFWERTELKQNPKCLKKFLKIKDLTTLQRTSC